MMNHIVVISHFAKDNVHERKRAFNDIAAMMLKTAFQSERLRKTTVKDKKR